jgi:hypothetical protein
VAAALVCELYNIDKSQGVAAKAKKLSHGRELSIQQPTNFEMKLFRKKKVLTSNATSKVSEGGI